MVAQNHTSKPTTKQAKDDSLSYIDGVFDRTSAQLASSRKWATEKASDTLDKTISPAQRDELSTKTQQFIDAHPRLAAFIAVNAVLTGIPILLFVLFSISVFVFSLTTGLILGTISALVFTASVVGVALLVVFPTVLFTTIAAFLVFFWGLIGFSVLRWATDARKQANAPHVASLNDQVRSIRNRIAESAEAASEQQSSQKASATALPTDRQTTVTVSTGKGGDAIGKIEVPDASTTGMVAS